MNITFMIGNGFDRNLNLNATFKAFVDEYKNISDIAETPDHIKQFKKDIKSNEMLWSNAEIH